MDKPQLLLTADGSHTVLQPLHNITYHSRHGAIQESMHVFIDAGLRFIAKKKKPIRILEMGLGTGLNALLSYREAVNRRFFIDYQSIEAYPLDWELIQKLNYPTRLQDPAASDFLASIHRALPDITLQLSPYFRFTLQKINLQDFYSAEYFDLIYYDAFAPEAQPELWTEEIFGRLIACSKSGACLVTYCSKGVVRRAMQSAGWIVTKLPGPPGKREMVRAVKPD